MKNTRHLIFDFDGTIVDSFHSIIKQFNLLADAFSFRKVADQEINDLRDLTSSELIAFLEIPPHKIPSVLLETRKLMHKEMQILPPFDYFPEILQRLFDLNITLGILSSNSLDNVTIWLEHNKMSHYFKFIYMESNYFGKEQVLREILKSQGMDKSKTFYIGDETRDIEAAKGCEINSVAVTWGFNSEKILLRHQPHYIIRKPEDLLTICQ